ncbi:hypothetical protein [Streptomyces sp. NPDC047000]|uniref:hypothetical protein n=1 Tax=Streptomyces sp. NPDC047000 TaxID=3155474 RepID=UPI0034000043
MSPGPQRTVRPEVHAREPLTEGHRFPGTGTYEVLTSTAGAPERGVSTDPGEAPAPAGL